MAELKFLNIGILSWITFIPLASVIAILFIPEKDNKNIKWIAASAAFLQLLLSLVLWASINNSVSGFNTLSSLQFIEKLDWFSFPSNSLKDSITVEYFLAVDGLSLPMIILTSLLAFICISYTYHTEKSVKAYFALFLILDTCLIGSFASMDFFLFFIFSTTSLINIYFLTGIFGGDNRVKSSSEFLIQSFAGSIIVFIIMLVLFYSSKNPVTDSHSFSIVSLTDFRNSISNSYLSGFLTKFRLIAFAALFTGFVLRLPIFPFHSRIIAVLTESPSPVSAYIAGSFIASGLYSIIRIALPIFPDASIYFSYVLAVTGIISIFYGAFCAVAQHDLKRAIAYYSISAAGFILIGIASITTQGISGAILQIFNAGLIIGVLFLITQILHYRANTLRIDKLNGLSKKMPRLFIISIIVFFAAASLPGLNNFISARLILSDIFNVSDLKIIYIISIVGILTISIFFVWLFIKLFFRNQTNSSEFLNDISLIEFLIFIPAILFIVLLGIFPSILTNIISSASTGLVEHISSASNLMRTGW